MRGSGLARLRQRLLTWRNSGQCNVCSGWFDDWPGGTCDACARR
ncbi:hypothetical protein [Streptomyces sp. NBC_01455]|nr:hypothetical protein [Streptomyces sp. NBC_01455]